MYCCASTALTAPVRTYDVQVLVFSHITPNTLSQQQWPVIAAPIANTLSNAPQKTAYDLQDEKNALMKNPHYKILLDASWLTSWTDGATLTFPLVSTDGQLNGSLVMTLGHYFDVNTNLFLTEPTSTLQSLDPNHYFSQFDQSTFTFNLSQHRRMRSNELDYFEHPLVGMLVKIIPIKNENTTQ
jgi:hypothetical protein